MTTPRIDPASLYKTNLKLREELDHLNRVVVDLMDRVAELENGRKPRSAKHTELDEQIMAIFQESPKLRFNRAAIAANLGVDNPADYALIVRRLKALHEANKITMANDNTSYPLYQLA